MDYRELENRLARNRDLIKERAYNRLVKEAKQAAKANRPQRRSWFATLRVMLLALKRGKIEPQPKVQLKPQQQLKLH